MKRRRKPRDVQVVVEPDLERIQILSARVVHDVVGRPERDVHLPALGAPPGPRLPELFVRVAKALRMLIFELVDGGLGIESRTCQKFSMKSSRLASVARARNRSRSPGVMM